MPRLLPALVSALLSVGLLASCAGAGRPELTDQTLPGERCSAENLAVGPVNNDGIPSAVAATRQELIDATVACDYRALARIARRDGTDITFEGESVPVARWPEREHDASPIMRPLASLLALAPVRVEGDGQVLLTWPDAVEWPTAGTGRPAERAVIEEAVGEAGLFGWTEAGGYSGWRVSIARDGRWARWWFGPVEGEYP